ncbi:CBS domain-containing protein [Marinilabiliaceae bacterium JC017]|nr:CBS domain-containing protein [Marinilabiliaceae bacterium JC017]
MELYLDSADLKEIEEAFKLGSIDGLTTTPTFMHRHGITNIDDTILKLSKMVPILQIEALGETAEEVVAEAKRLLALGLDKKKTVFKIPASLEAVRACKMLRDEDIMVNIHLVYNLQQAYMAAAAGATYICVLVGRMQDQGYDALQLVGECVEMVDHYGYDSKVMFSSVRNPEHIKNALHLGAHTCTIPWRIMKQMNENKFTEIGTQQFFAHTRQMTMKVREAIEDKNPTVGLDATVTEASIEMTASGMGAVSIVDDKGDLAGIFTDGDLRRHLNEDGENFLKKKMREFKLFQPISLDGEDTLNKAIEIFKEKQIDNIIAVSDRKPIGMLDIQDLIKLNVIE